MLAALRDPFLGALLLVMVMATLWPVGFMRGGVLGLEAWIAPGIALVFFLHGVGIPRTELLRGVKQIRLHLAVQSMTFLMFPLLGLAVMTLLAPVLPADLLLGFFFLAVLPSTISSSVAMTALAGGNVPAAVFNASLSGLLGIVLTPLWLTQVSGQSGWVLPWQETLLTMTGLLLIPFVGGQLLHPWLAPRLAPWKAVTLKLDRGVILMLVLVSFADAVAGGLWRDHGVSILLSTTFLAVFMMTVMFSFTRLWARWQRLPLTDETVLVFCGSKKTLASGVPMASVLFVGHPGIGLILLPLLVYHQIQLVVAAVLAQRYRRIIPEQPSPLDR